MQHFILLLALPTASRSLAAPVAPGNGAPGKSEKINWPSAYDPSKSKCDVHNETVINATPEIFWRNAH